MNVQPWNFPLWQALTRDRARMPHALLLQGPKGVGKRAFASALAQWLLCEAPEETGACGRCKSCGWFEQGAHPDFRRLQPTSESGSEDDSGKKTGKLIGIGEIRELGDFIGLVSHQGGWRVVVIQPAEAMNQAAGNALLKTLEEPPAGVLLILVAHQPRRLLATVRSRCRKLAFALPARDQARTWLQEQGLAQAAAALDEVGGAPLLAVDCSEPERLQRRQRFLTALVDTNAVSLSKLAQEFQQRLDESWGWLSRWLFDLLAIQAAVAPRYFPEHTAVLERLARRARPVALWRLQQELLAAGRWLKHPLNGQLLLESWLISYLEAMEIGHGR